MLKLYHGQNSVCSQKARVALAELDRPYESIILNLGAGDQFKPEYLKLNPNAVVPTIDDDGKVVIESSIIIDYLNETTDGQPLMPRDPYRAALIRIWLLRCLDIHASVNSLSFGAAYRKRFLKNTREEREAIYLRMPDPAKQAKRRDLVENGVASHYVDDAIRFFKVMFADMDTALARAQWLDGDTYSLADTALIAYVDRLNRLRFNGFWEKRHPRVGDWYARSKARPSYVAGIEDFAIPEEDQLLASGGSEAWPIIEKKLEAM